MDATQPPPVWFIPLFPLFFVAMIAVVTAIIAEVGGWSGLARLYADPGGDRRGPIRVFRIASLDLRRSSVLMSANYSNCAIIEVSSAGVHLRMWLPLRFRHPPLLIPWSRMERVQPGRYLFWRTVSIHPQDASTRIRLYGRPAAAVEEAWRQYNARPAEMATA